MFPSAFLWIRWRCLEPTLSGVAAVEEASIYSTPECWGNCHRERPQS